MTSGTKNQGKIQTEAEERIVNAAIECLEEYGLEGTTLRRIAQRAGVNSAAVNYYFRSKERLIEEAMERTLQNAFDWRDFANSETMGPSERLVAVLDSLIEGAMRFPGIVRAHFYETVVHGNYETKMMRRLEEFLDELKADLAAREVGLGEAELKTGILQIVSAAILPAALMPRLFDLFGGFSLADPGARRSYLRRLVERLL